MAYNPDYINCTICGIELGGDSGEWKGDVIALAGPHWPDSSPSSFEVVDEDIVRYAAEAQSYRGSLLLLPEKSKVDLQCEYDAHREPDDPDHITTARMFVAVHAACEDIAKRVMKKSLNARVRSVGELWLTLERRCVRSQRGPFGRTMNFVPEIRNWAPDRPVSFDTGRYYVSYHCIANYGDEWKGWWDEDPIVIQDLTSMLLSNIEPVYGVSTCQSGILSQLRARLDALPQEIKDHICAYFQDDPLPLICNYVMPQSMWKQVLLQVPFLWDLDVSVMAEKIHQTELEKEQWDWEKLTRKVLSPAQVPTPEANEYDSGVWDYGKVELNVPGGLTNRRRIWQILQEMYPNDVHYY